MDGRAALHVSHEDFVKQRKGYSAKSNLRFVCIFSLINLVEQQAKYLASVIYDDPRDRDLESTADYLRAECAALFAIYRKIQPVSEVADPEVVAEVAKALDLLLERIDNVSDMIWALAEPRLEREP